MSKKRRAPQKVATDKYEPVVATWNLDLGFSLERPYTYSNWNLVEEFGTDFDRAALKTMVRNNFIMFVMAMLGRDIYGDKKKKK